MIKYTYNYFVRSIMLWENLREEEFDLAIKESSGLCVLPLGCIEKHGQHLPVGTDYFETMSIVKEAAKREKVVIFSPGAWLGEVSCYHALKDPARMDLRGNIAIKQSTILTVLSELCDEIARNGFNKILIVNGHGGNTSLLRHFLRSQSYEVRDYATLLTSAFDFKLTEPRRLLSVITNRKKDFSYLTDEDIATILRFAESGTGGAHADIRETSMVMAYDESLVAKERYEAESGVSTGKSKALKSLGVETVNEWLADYPNSYEASPPIGASANIGRAMIRVSSERLAKIFKAVKEDEQCLKSAKMLIKDYK